MKTIFTRDTKTGRIRTEVISSSGHIITAGPPSLGADIAARKLRAKLAEDKRNTVHRASADRLKKMMQADHEKMQKLRTKGGV